MASSENENQSLPEKYSAFQESVISKVLIANGVSNDKQRIDKFQRDFLSLSYPTPDQNLDELLKNLLMTLNSMCSSVYADVERLRATQEDMKYLVRAKESLNAEIKKMSP